MRPSCLPSLVALGSSLLASVGSAVVISTGDGSGNTTAPADDPGFANVGVSNNNLSGVYLGNGWVLTAAHVGNATGFTFGGVFYDAVPDSRVSRTKSPKPGQINCNSAIYAEAKPVISEMRRNSPVRGTPSGGEKVAATRRRCSQPD